MLEPRQEFEGTILFYENDEINEVLFFIKGLVDIGFMINKQEQYCLRLHKDSIIGAYNICCNKRTKFIYKAQTHCKGMFIRRSNWKDIMSNPDLTIVTTNFEKSVTTYYQDKIYKNMIREKHRAINKWMKRADYQAIISLKDVKMADPRHNLSVIAEGEESLQPDIEKLSAKIDGCVKSNTKIMDCFDVLKVRYAELE